MADTLPLRERFRIARALIGKGVVGLFQDNAAKQAYGLLSGLFPGAVGAIPPRTGREFLKAYTSSPWLRSVTSKVAHSVAMTHYRLYYLKGATGKPKGATDIQSCPDIKQRALMLRAARKAGDLVEVTEHPFFDLMAKPNPWMSGYAMRKLWQVYLELNGEQFAVKERAFGPNNPPTGLWPIPPYWVINTPTPEERTFRVNFRGWHGNIPDTELIWIAEMDPTNPYWRGAGVAGALADELDTHEYASKYLAAMFYNRAMPDALIFPKGPTQTSTGDGGAQNDELRRLKARWMQEHRGFWRSFVPFFSSREIDVKVLTPTLQSLQMTELMQYERDATIQTFGIPPEIMGVLMQSNKATIDAADYLYSRWTVLPRQEFNRAEYQRTIVPEFDDRLILDFDTPVQADNEFTLKVFTAAPYSGLVDEYRNLAGLDPLPNNDGQVHPIPLGVTFQETLGGTETAPVTTPPDPEQESLRRDITVRANWITTRAGKRVLSIARTVADRLEPKARKKFEASLKKLKGRVDVERLAAAINAGEITQAMAAIDFSAMSGDMGEAAAFVVSTFAVAGELSASQLVQVGIQTKFDLTNPRAVAWAKTRSSTMIREVTEQTKDAVRAIIGDAIANGHPPREAARAIRSVVGLTTRQSQSVMGFRQRLIDKGVATADVERRTQRYADATLRKRALTIARTETIAASNGGQHESWHQAADKGLIDKTKTQRVWIVTDDDRLDEEVCEPMEDQKTGLDGMFTTGDGDSVDDPPAHPNCRCDVGLEFSTEG